MKFLFQVPAERAPASGRFDSFGHDRRTAGFGASRPLRRISAIVSFLNPQPAFSLDRENASSCPEAAVQVSAKSRPE